MMLLEKILTILEYFENEALTEGWVTNLQPEKTAQDWVRNGFTPEEVWRYLEARCPIPSKAAELKERGITPDKAAEHYGYDEDDFPMTLGEAFCVGEIDFEPENRI
ncbi:hypothetical protein N8668_02185 [bacterium]|nr:hypothetical protein [bacterium]